MRPRPGFARLLAGLALALAPSAPVAAAAPRAPNVVVILLDDLGWGDFSCFGNTAARTPHIDRLAREGLRAPSARRPAPTCRAVATRRATASPSTSPAIAGPGRS